LSIADQIVQQIDRELLGQEDQGTGGYEFQFQVYQQRKK